MSADYERCYFAGLQKDTFSKTTNITQNSLFLQDFTVVMKKLNVTVRIWSFFNSNFYSEDVELSL